MGREFTETATATTSTEPGSSNLSSATNWPYRAEASTPPPPEELRFTLQRNAIYHERREYYFDFLNKILNLIVIISGATAFSEATNIKSSYAAFVAMIAGTLQLVFDLSVRARHHNKLREKYISLLSDLELDYSNTESHKKIHSSMTRIWADEPPTMRIVDSIAYNLVVSSTAKTNADLLNRIHIPAHCYIFSHLFSFSGFVPTTERERLEASSKK